MSLPQTKLKMDSQEISTPGISPIWEEPDLKDLREFRELKDNDLKTVESLLNLPKEIALSHHNFFSLNREKTLESLEREINSLKTEMLSASEDRKKTLGEKIAYSYLFRELTVKYDWTAAWGVNVVLERRKPKEEQE